MQVRLQAEPFKTSVKYSATSRRIPATAGLVPQRALLPARERCLVGEEHRPTGTSPVVAVEAGIVAGEEHSSTGTCPVVACSPRKHLWRPALAKNGGG